MPAMLRLGLIESVRRMALRTVQRLDEVETADAWAGRLGGSRRRRRRSARERARRVRRAPTRPLARRSSPASCSSSASSAVPCPGSARLEQWIAEEGMSAEDAARRATERLALTQVMMANSITSLRAIARMDWEAFVERQSVMEAVLRRDPAGVYPRMTFATRDQYRHVVERIAKRTGTARRPRSARDGACAHERRRGGRARPRARRLLPGRRRTRASSSGDRLPAPPLREASTAGSLRHPNLRLRRRRAGRHARRARGAALARRPRGARGVARSSCSLALIPANDIAVSVVNQLVTAFLPPRVLPKLDLRDGRRAGRAPHRRRGPHAVRQRGGGARRRSSTSRCSSSPTARRTSTSRSSATSPTRPTETRRGRRRDPRGRGRGRARAQRALRARAARRRSTSSTAPAAGTRARASGWGGSASAASWPSSTASCADGAAGRVLDRSSATSSRSAASATSSRSTPTRCCRPTRRRCSSARWRIRSTAPCYDAAARPGGRAATASCSRASASRCRARTARASPRSTRAIPAWIRTPPRCRDVYQDLYGEGSFTGKGIYDVDAFEQATHGRFPENTLLSHDLIEGSYARAGLVTDIIVYDDYPARYLTLHPAQAPLDPRRLAAAALAHARGCRDRTAPSPTGSRCSRAGRSSTTCAAALVEIAQLALLRRRLDWCFPASPLRWTLLGLGAIAAPWIVALLLAVLRPPLDKSLARLLRGGRPRRGHQRAAGRARDRVPAAPGLGLGRRDRPHALAPGRVPAAPARVADGLADRAQVVRRRAAPPGARCGPPWPSASARSPRSAGWMLSRGGAHALEPLVGAVLPLVGALARVARDRARAQRAGRAPRAPAAAWRAGPGAALRAAALALLRPLRRRGRPTGSRPTTSRRIRRRSWRCARRPPTSGSSCSPR